MSSRFSTHIRKNLGTEGLFYFLRFANDWKCWITNKTCEIVKNYGDTLPLSTVLNPFFRRRKKEKKKSSSKPAAEGEEQEDVEICLGSGKGDIL